MPANPKINEPLQRDNRVTHSITLIPGDGIGPEVSAAARQVLDASGVQFQWQEALAGVAALEALGDPLPEATVEAYALPMQA